MLLTASFTVCSAATAAEQYERDDAARACSKRTKDTADGNQPCLCSALTRGWRCPGWQLRLRGLRHGDGPILSTRWEHATCSGYRFKSDYPAKDQLLARRGLSDWRDVDSDGRQYRNDPLLRAHRLDAKAAAERRRAPGLWCHPCLASRLHPPRTRAWLFTRRSA